MSAQIASSLPVLLLFLLAAWGWRMKRACVFQRPSPPVWPYAANPALALELADSPEFMDAVLGSAATSFGAANRRAAILVQRLDFVFIPLYILFFAAAAFALGGGLRGLLAIVCILLAAGFHIAVDQRVLRILNGLPAGSLKPLGQWKWFFYFAALGAEGILLLFTRASAARAVSGFLLGLFLIAIAAGGISSARKGSFTGIASAANLSVVALTGLAFAPLVMRAPFSWRVVAEYAILMRVPLIIEAVLFGIPFVAFFTGARSLLRGLFDLTPPSVFVVTLTAMAVAGSVCMASSLVLLHASERFGVPPVPVTSLPPSWVWFLVMLLLSLPVTIFSVRFSAIQGRGGPRLATAAIGGITLAAAIAAFLMNFGTPIAGVIVPWLASPRFEKLLADTTLFAGYVRPGHVLDPWPNHLSALVAFLSSAVLYGLVGIYGWLRLGKSRTVPALGSALMLLMTMCWMLAAATFFFDAWRIPVMLIIGLAGTLTAQSQKSDHFYRLISRATECPAPDPVETITIPGTSRLIVAAANGGGIQAGAWAAQVLYGLQQENGEKFERALRMISSVSGGSVGSACFVNWLANPNTAVPPFEAAAKSSLDEVAWGLAWTDLLRALLPWVFGGLIGRGRALEKAWLLNASRDPAVPSHLDDSLSSWNGNVAAGVLPALVMNATVAESGERLLLATTRMGGDDVHGRARVDATELHTVNGVERDVSVVTAARLSASFPYVTPAARSDAPGPQPHVVDGGYYDNYGMATIVEWLDEALTKSSTCPESVLVIQIHGAPVAHDFKAARHAKSHGWFYQAIAPLTTLAAVRTSGQVAHNDIELELLQQKWDAAGVPIHSVTFEFHNPDVPLSWHLTPQEVNDISKVWNAGMDDCRRQVKQFLGGSDNLNCGCPRCAGASADAARGH